MAVKYEACVALGDSMSIDEYAGAPNLGAASLLYCNDDERYPEFVGRDLKTTCPGLRFRNAAWDGCTSGQLAYWLHNLEPDPRPTVLTLTIGGNDLLGWWTSAAADLATELAAFSARLDRILTELRHRFPQASILVGNVYDPSDGTGVLESGRAFQEGPAALRDLNQVIASVVGLNEGRLVDIHGHFLGHGVRATDSGFHAYHAEDPTVWYIYDIEPNARGSSEIRRLFWYALQGETP